MAKLKFLIVEDDLFYQTYVNDLLAETGVEVLNASDGETGLNLALAEKPDLIITDIEIPKIQGFVLFKKLRENPETRDIPVVMMSAKVEKALLEKHSRLSLHAEGYLVKPFNGQALIDMIRDVIGEEFGYSEVEIGQEPDTSVRQPDAPSEENAPEIAQFPEEDPKTGSVDRQITVLVVDDSRYICDITRDFLEEAGVKTVTASDGESGYQKACDLLPDLVLLDVQMPGMNGFVVCEMLRKRPETRNLPIILMSAVVDDESFQRHSKLRYHADAYLQKPFMKSELHDLVHRFTDLDDEDKTDREEKTGFFVPLEDEKRSGATPAPADPRLAEELKQTRAELEAVSEQRTRLEADLERVRKTSDQMEAELFELRKTAEGSEKGIQDKITLATQRFNAAREESEKLAAENETLRSRLDEITTGENSRFEELERDLEKAQEALKAREAENRTLSEKLLAAGSNDDLKAQVNELGHRLQEASARALEMENRNSVLEEETEELRRSAASGGEAAEGAGEDKALIQEIEALKRDLRAATEAKREIEDQAKTLLGKGEKPVEKEHVQQELERAREENRELAARISEAEAREKELEELRPQLEQARSESVQLREQLHSVPQGHDAELAEIRDQLSRALARAESLEEGKNEQARSLDELRIRNAELEKRSEELQKEIEESRKLAATETQSRMDLEGRLESQIEEKKLLARELEEVRHERDEARNARGRIDELQARLDEGTKLHRKADEEIGELTAALVDLKEKGRKVEGLERENAGLRAALEETQKRCEKLEEEAEQLAARGKGSGRGSKDDDAPWEERLTQLESTLGKTVREAQVILMEQRGRESGLEESAASLMKALEEERAAHRREREAWGTREGELKEAFEDALMESRRLIGEEAARLFPMHLPRRSKPLEVVSMKNRYGVAAAAALAALVLFGGGYFFKGRTVPTPGQAVVPVQEIRADAQPRMPAGSPPEVWIGQTDSYEELWRRNTIQSVSDDMMIQATLHTRQELEAAIKYTAVKEGWTRERTQKAMTDMALTYNLSEFYYVTVYSKNLKGGYPGYADGFERHLSLRGQSGREARAYLTGELEGSKFITSRVSSAGKEMNPEFLYEVGLTVAFRKEELGDKPSGLQLVLYDIGAVPMRVLTWDMSAIGSLSSWETAGRPAVSS